MSLAAVQVRMGMRMMVMPMSGMRVPTVVVLVRAVPRLFQLDARRLACALCSRPLPPWIRTATEREHDEDREGACHGFFLGDALAIFFFSAASSSSTVVGGGRRVD